MILVDTSVWVDSLRGGATMRRLAGLLDEGSLAVHAWVIGELALGNLGRRAGSIIGDLRILPRSPLIPDDEVMQMIAARRLQGSGIGWVDAQILASAMASGSGLWTLDRALSKAASRFLQ